MLRLSLKSIEVLVLSYPAIITTCLLASILYTLVHFYFKMLQNKKQVEPIYTEKNLIRELSSRNIPTVTWFPFAIPVFDGILTLLRLRYRGIAILNELQIKFGKHYWLPLGHQKFFVMNDVNMIQVSIFILNRTILQNFFFELKTFCILISIRKY